MATPTFEEIRREATAKYQSDKLREQGNDYTANTPEDRELRESGYFREAQRKLMRERGVSTRPRTRQSFTARAKVPSLSSAYTPVFTEPGERSRRSAETISRLKAKQTPEPALRTPEGNLIPLGDKFVHEPTKSEKLAQRMVKEAVQPSGRSRYEETQAALGTGQPRGPAAVERRETVQKGRFGNIRHRLRTEEERGRKRPAGISFASLTERVAPTQHAIYGRAGTFEIYDERGPFGRRFYRVRFQGRTFTPAFDTPEQARTFIEGLKSRAEPEYAARRERMAQADARFFTETTLAHRQHPLFVKVVDRTRPPPSRLTS
jgi:hypothetical protein